MFQSALLKPDVMWERHRNPLSGWTRIALGLAAPFVIWSHDWLLIVLFITAIITNPYWFPPVKPGNKNLDIMTRLVDAERWWLTRYATRYDLALLFLPAIALSIPALYFLWVHSLFWGGFFFIAIAAYKALFSLRVMELAEQKESTPAEDEHQAQNKETGTDTATTKPKTARKSAKKARKSA